MSSKYTGVVLAVLIIASSSFFLSYELNVPQVNAFGFPPVPANASKFVDVTLYAEQSGWDYNLGPSQANPTLVFQAGTVVNFTVIEEDTLIHNLAINPGTSELGNASIILDIAPPQLSQQKAQVYFAATGVYTYWCTVHPTTMVGLIYVNNSIPGYSLPALPAGYPVNYSETLTINSGYISNSTGVHNPSLYYPTGSAVNFTIAQGQTSNSSFNIAPGSSESSINETAINASSLGNSIGTQKNFAGYFKNSGEYTYWDAYNPMLTEGHIFIADNNGTVQLNVTNSGITFNGSSNFTIPVANSSNVRFALNDGIGKNYSFSISGNQAERANMSGNTSTVFYFSFLLPSAWQLSVALPGVSNNSIDVYLSEVNISVSATLSGFYVNNLTNPNLYFSTFTLVKFILNNSDDLNNTIAINSGTSENASNYTLIAATPAGMPSSSGFYVFITSGNYTLWNTYHPSSDILLISVSSSNLAAGGISTLSILHNIYYGNDPIYW